MQQNKKEELSFETGEPILIKILRWRSEVLGRVKTELEAFVEQLEVPANADSMTEKEKAAFAQEKLEAIDSIAQRSVKLMSL